MNFNIFIGLEIHLELATKSKMFCSCPNIADEIRPNFNICEVCTGQPGVLPVVNKQAVIFALKLAKALNCQINKISYFARKNYFYPDLPKNYQISQYDLPLAFNGNLSFYFNEELKNIRIKRIHLEEDTGKLLHLSNYSLVDFNRSGVPLLELVTEPDIKSAEEAKLCVEELITIIRYLEISEANPEKGQIRFEANISLSTDNNLGTKVEVKNLGSLKSLKDAINYEIERQKNLILRGEKINQETRGFDEKKRTTFSQRHKETSEDYRYFPEPDLPFLELDDDFIKSIHLPELPNQKRERFIKEYNLSLKEINILTKDRFVSNFYEKTISELKEEIDNNFETRFVYNLLVNDIFGLLEKYNQNLLTINFSPHHFAHLISEYYKGNLNIKLVKKILTEVIEHNHNVEDLLTKLNKIDDVQELTKLVEESIEKNSQAVQDYKEGKKNALQFLVGYIMKKTKGQVDINILKDLLIKKLEENF
ncbi:MAG: aspartyl/glutamyl-tRNA(Asn/Gln) amidotransferase subunit B [Candidatus Parcubacteria bacterium]|nr:MAG: aspartyl/glutamyl-tRNA(Asn/Gln) amidotransferase subunit B [Candidatus Parcubacteria bacterium]